MKYIDNFLEKRYNYIEYKKIGVFLKIMCYVQEETELLKISRLLTPEHRTDLLALVQVAYAAENSARKSLGTDRIFTLKPQEYSCENIMRRRKK